MSTQLTRTNNKSNLSPAAEPSILRKREDDAMHEEQPQTDIALQMKSIFEAYSGGAPLGSGDGDNTLNKYRLYDYLNAQPKLTVGSPTPNYGNDPDRVVAGKEALNNTPIKATSEIVNRVLRQPGKPIESKTRNLMESRFNRDFGKVSIHTGSDAALSAKSLQAKAYTTGSDIVFGQGQYLPESSKGKWLLAHELAHVAQQSSGHSSLRQKAENEASSAASKVMYGKNVKINEKKRKDEIYLFGEPENVPETTYVTTQGGQGFLQSAVEYHQAWGLTPRRINSIEDIVTHLAGGNGHLGRIRIVLHAADIGMFSSLFDNEPRFSIQEDRLSAWAESDIAGLEHDFGELLNINLATVSQVTSNMRVQNPSILQPFGIEVAGNPTGSLLTLFNRSAELAMLRQVRTVQNGAQIDVFIDSLNSILASVIQRVISDFNVTEQDVIDYQNGVIGGGWQPFQFQPAADQTNILREANRAVAGGFRNNLNLMRARFDNSSWIDIRGCNVGTDDSYLESVSRFFGASQALPHVSGPNWFQVFPRFGSRAFSTGAQMNQVAGNHEVTEALDTWSVMTGVREQLSYLRSYYESELLRRQILASASESTMPLLPDLMIGLLPPTFSDLPLPIEDRLLIDLIFADSLRMPELRMPGDENPSSFSSNSGQLNFPGFLETMIQEALDRLNEPGAEFRFYLESAMLLPVFGGSNAQDFSLYVHTDLQTQAMHNWLESQWTTQAPGLQNLLSAQPFSANNRRIQALVEYRVGQEPANAQMVFPPNPLFWDHINRI